MTQKFKSSINHHAKLFKLCVSKQRSKVQKTDRKYHRHIIKKVEINVCVSDKSQIKSVSTELIKMNFLNTVNPPQKT